MIATGANPVRLSVSIWKVEEKIFNPSNSFISLFIYFLSCRKRKHTELGNKIICRNPYGYRNNGRVKAISPSPLLSHHRHHHSTVIVSGSIIPTRFPKENRAKISRHVRKSYVDSRQKRKRSAKSSTWKRLRQASLTCLDEHNIVTKPFGAVT